MPFKDVLLITLLDGTIIVPDLVIAMLFIIMKQIAGQLFEV